MSVLADEVRAALRSVADPCSIATGVPIDIVAMGLVSQVTVSEGAVSVTLRLTSPFCMQVGLLTEQAQRAVRRLPEVSEVRIDVDHAAEWLPEMIEPDARTALRRIRPLPTAAS